MEKSLPELCQFFRWTYGTKALLIIDSTNSLVSETGVRQGDPLGPLYFCLGIASTLEDLKRKYDHLFVLAYADNIQLIGDPNEMDNIMKDLELFSGKIGLTLTRDKCVRISTSANSLDTLGTFVGSVGSMKDWCVEKCERYSRILAHISTLDANVAIPLIQSCVNSKPMYLARTLPPWASLFGLGEFDKCIDNSLAHVIAGLDTLPRIASKIRAQPKHQGGLDIPLLNPLATSAWSISFTNSMRTLAQHEEHLVSGFHKLRLEKDLFVRHVNLINQTITTEVTVDNKSLEIWANPRNPPISLTQAHMMKSISDSRHQHILRVLKEKKDGYGLNWFVSEIYRGSGLWLYPPPFQSLTPQAYLSCVRRRLLMVPPTSSNNMCVNCNDRNVDSRYHCLSCMKLQKSRTDRHNYVLDDFVSVLRRLVGRGNVEAEVLVDANSNKSMDVVANINGISYYIDFCIVNPASAAYTGNLDRCGDVSAILKHAEDAKRAKYSDCLRALNVNMSRFIPFAMSASGLLGPSASLFFGKLLETKTFRHSLKSWYQTVRFRLASAIGFMDANCPMRGLGDSR